MALTLDSLAEYLHSVGIPCQVDGDGSAIVESVATLEDATRGQLSFLSNPKYEPYLETTRAEAVLVRPDVKINRQMSLLRTPDPYAAVTAAIVRLHGYRKHPWWGVSEQAIISPTARIGANANIAPGVYIDDGAEIGDNATLYPGVYIARGTRIGNNVTLFPNVVIYENCVLGNNVTIHAGTVIGEDGLGYAPVNEKWVKIPQIGNVIIGDDVEMGPNCTIDRATLGSTVIGSGTKFSNLVAIGHGTKVGEDCLFVAQVGLAGSVTVGRHVTIAGQAGVVGHITIGDNAVIGAKAGVSNSIEAGATVLGQPAVAISECKRQIAVMQQLPKLKNEIKRMRRELDRLLQLAGEKPRSVEKHTEPPVAT
ncbi:MAG TPA: UDP-3-O-(3-hydroxymyristoyl)glucosamine N-acyltransferase [Phycisphaerae bacterium]|nr:UDP-3-O-(3-hydroxymyristoyl)glucosamine N-acyltransferase [Phycisphaerae bacterium]HOJ73179.1 UDP-3-O-(3-hydroxymyristoyl)glucosamine N-acyltransferase [Phycisphaerae bacterium]HOM52168.1 UDP-3-O-(3-hydroxymyristoyl)glucosamine N-acyltransferase [Phycisphaerae bacterium]HON68055.1 UDP-3-O-(3-hydroxymyristoyl)glucosamine N-acyltransferase [Phycisphaerae bacterium]HOQ85324.1 UDP-3-O-(3-hydroxymyristoyl)glucosamine N-acyltransferase [Phycisphaerae bacterium]